MSSKKHRNRPGNVSAPRVPQIAVTRTPEQRMAEMRANHGNQICLAVPLGEMVPTPFVEHELDTFVRALPFAAAIHAHGSYHQNTANQLVYDFLTRPDMKQCDYLCFYEHDMVPPAHWLERVRRYDPTKHHVVGPMYFRRQRADMRPIPGRWSDDEKRTYAAISREEVEYMVSHPGFHAIDCPGLGATAISRWMLERWDPALIPWFHTPIGPSALVPSEAWPQIMAGDAALKHQYNPALCESHDVYFCRNAQKQGFNVLMDSAILCEHYGWYPYDLTLYRQGWYNSKRRPLTQFALATELVA